VLGKRKSPAELAEEMQTLFLRNPRYLRETKNNFPQIPQKALRKCINHKGFFSKEHKE
jgi:hypothetical protein